VWSLGPDGAPRRHDVRVAFLAGDRVAVASGLDGVERVVTDGAPYLTPSSRTRAADGPAADTALPPTPGAGARGAR
jgi:hypothetical protein